MNIHDYHRAVMNTAHPTSFDIITDTCICGCSLFMTPVRFHKGEIAGYMLDIECVECGNRYKAPTPLDEEGIYEPVA